MKKIAAGILTLMLAGAGILLWTRPVPNHRPEIQEANVTEEVRVPISPFRVGFSPAGIGKLGEPVAVDLVVQAQPENWPPELIGDETLEFLLRLPVGVKLRSKGWEPVELPPEEKKDPAGPWSLFERKIPLSIPTVVSKELARERVELAVVERGVNWIITTRARIVHGSQSWQTFGVVFATVDGKGEVEFHAVPRTSQTEQRAEANRS